MPASDDACFAETGDMQPPLCVKAVPGFRNWISSNQPVAARLQLVTIEAAQLDSLPLCQLQRSYLSDCGHRRKTFPAHESSTETATIVALIGTPVNPGLTFHTLARRT